MTAQIIDGTALSQRVRSQVAERAAALAARGIKPGLAVILVGDDSASAVYVRNKVKACQDNGLHSVLERYSAAMLQDALLARITALNADPAIHGILVQMPLPKQLDARALDQLHAAQWRGRPQAGQASHQLTGAGDRKAVDVLGRCDGLDDPVGVELLG